MTPIEQKSLEAQLELAKDVIAADDMIVYYIKSYGRSVFNDVLVPKFREFNEKETIEFTKEQFMEIFNFMKCLDSNCDCFDKIGNGSIKQYIDEKNVKTKLLRMLKV